MPRSHKQQATSSHNGKDGSWNPLHQRLTQPTAGPTDQHQHRPIPSKSPSKSPSGSLADPLVDPLAARSQQRQSPRSSQIPSQILSQIPSQILSAESAAPGAWTAHGRMRACGRQTPAQARAGYGLAWPPAPRTAPEPPTLR
ncbi:hypothetical protein G7046_g6449 [Stylonectria norvegica]|nr:hypothetical protein G7046_g6449 [Stylonectria norvegica]